MASSPTTKLGAPCVLAGASVTLASEPWWWIAVAAVVAALWAADRRGGRA